MSPGEIYGFIALGLNDSSKMVYCLINWSWVNRQTNRR